MLPLLIAAALLAAQTAAGSSSDADVRAAIEEAVRARMGEAATVVVEDLAVRRAPVAANGAASRRRAR
jgi:hypothetical protein